MIHPAVSDIKGRKSLFVSDALPVPYNGKTQLQGRALSQLETRFQRGPSHVRHYDGM